MNSGYFPNDTPQAGSSSSRSNRHMNLNSGNLNANTAYVVPIENGFIHSNLTPTAREFTPSGMYMPFNGGDKSRGAIRKQSGNYKGGSSRQFAYNKYNNNRENVRQNGKHNTDSQYSPQSNQYGRRYGRYDKNSSKTYYGRNNKNDNWRRSDTKRNSETPENKNNSPRVLKKSCKCTTTFNYMFYLFF